MRLLELKTTWRYLKESKCFFNDADWWMFAKVFASGSIWE